jgi:hypothetical protein
MSEESTMSEETAGQEGMPPMNPRRQLIGEAVDEHGFKKLDPVERSDLADAINTALVKNGLGLSSDESVEAELDREELIAKLDRLGIPRTSLSMELDLYQRVTILADRTIGASPAPSTCSSCGSAFSSETATRSSRPPTPSTPSTTAAPRLPTP